MKLENIPVRTTQLLHIKLADFSLSRHAESLSTFCGTPAYCAPGIGKTDPKKYSRIDPYTTAVGTRSRITQMRLPGGSREH